MPVTNAIQTDPTWLGLNGSGGKIFGCLRDKVNQGVARKNEHLGRVSRLSQGFETEICRDAHPCSDGWTLPVAGAALDLKSVQTVMRFRDFISVPFVKAHMI